MSTATIFRWLDRLRSRAFGAVASWSVTLDGKLTWWSPDDNHVRERRLNHEWQPRRVFRPLCWLLDPQEYYGHCIYCEKPRNGRTRGWRLER